VSTARSLSQAQLSEISTMEADMRAAQSEVRRLAPMFHPVLQTATGESVEVSLLQVFDDKDFLPVAVPQRQLANFFAGRERNSWLDVRNDLRAANARKEGKNAR